MRDDATIALMFGLFAILFIGIGFGYYLGSSNKNHPICALAEKEADSRQGGILYFTDKSDHTGYYCIKKISKSDFLSDGNSCD